MKASPDDLTGRLARQIAFSGPISVAEYMAAANGHYYATRDPLGAAGDFTTAPEISQMFGELVGLWMADLWSRAGRPDVHYAELGPGRGTLTSDALRAMRAGGLMPRIAFVENSPALRQIQAAAVPDACWHDDLSGLPDDDALLVVANEFFDALPVRQLIRGDTGWHEMVVDHEEAGFVRKAGPAVPMPPDDAPPGTLFETSPAGTAVMRELAHRIVQQGGAALIVDYGASGGSGDTLQAVSRHAYADPWTAPGTRDLTAHVDFNALAEGAIEEGAQVFGPVTQGHWLRAMGIDARCAALEAAAPSRDAEVRAARDRLVDAAQMGDLFKVIAITAPGWPVPEGFA